MESRRLFIVDTNVPMVANATGRFSKECEITCAKMIESIIKNDAIALDDKRQILCEYIARLRTQNRNMISDVFLKWVLTNQENPERCVLVPIKISDNDYCVINEFPHDADLGGFHRKDRKFVAIAVAHPLHPPILQAVDSKWWRFRTRLERAKVTTIFLCKKDIIKILGRKKA